ncbi:enolase C-terminal domain-like protein [Halomarina pelagica]|uniref:enolase C-terminal domain-like protein n=1 Tax=Halomarina pelagica TaxID=2961599 RepID=UPI0020C38FEA|nr:enolase C-terminal domain-like protein [Halomarina sp. BND7]
MRISELEIHEFTYELDDVGTRHGHQGYAPGETLEPPGFVLTIRTADGLEGHYRGFYFVPPMLAQIRMASADLLDRDPLEREEVWQDLWKALRHLDHVGMGPIDVALWDLAGNHYGASVAELLGGTSEPVPAYASTFMADDEGGLDSPAAYADFAETCLDAGYPAYKLHAFGDPDRDVAACRAVAERVGDEMDLMLDPASEYDTYADALRVGRVLDELDFFWYEDPMADGGESTEMNRQLARDLDTPVLGVEHVRGGPFTRANHLAGEALDLVRADAHLDGGITGAMKIAAVAESFGRDVELHVGGPAHLHCMSAIRNTNYYEHGLLHPAGIEWMSAQGFVESPERVNDDGTVPIPDGPGLGVEVDWDFVEARLTNHEVIDEPLVSGLA